MAEIKATRFDGIEFFSGMPVQIYEKPDGHLALKGDEQEKVFIAYPVGLVPYEWIDYVDLEGDEHAYIPLFHCKFKGKTNWNFWKKLRFFGYPYKELSYYTKSDTYRKGHDPADWEFRYIEVKNK